MTFFYFNDRVLRETNTWSLNKMFDQLVAERKTETDPAKLTELNDNIKRVANVIVNRSDWHWNQYVN